MKGKLPKSWDDVTLKHLIDIENIRNDKSIDAEPYADLTRNLLMLSLFTGIPYGFYEEMPMNELKEDIKAIEFLKVLPSDKPRKKFKCGGYSWKVNFDTNELSATDFIEHYELTKDSTKVIENSNRIMALYCQPYKYGFKKKLDNKEKAEILKDIPITVIYPLVVFFCNLYPLLLEGIKDYLSSADKILTNKLKEISQDQAEVV
tara:strand:+ start:1161 stop:1772 length:612 start_codon:yes stop_codon:yes gene_type:complete